MELVGKIIIYVIWHLEANFKTIICECCKDIILQHSHQYYNPQTDSEVEKLPWFQLKTINCLICVISQPSHEPILQKCLFFQSDGRYVLKCPLDYTNWIFFPKLFPLWRINKRNSYSAQHLLKLSAVVFVIFQSKLKPASHFYTTQSLHTRGPELMN